MAKSHAQEHGVFGDVIGEEVGLGFKLCVWEAYKHEPTNPWILHAEFGVDDGHEEAKQKKKFEKRRRRPKHGQIATLKNKELSTMSRERSFT